MTDLQRRLMLKYCLTLRQAQVAELASRGITNRVIAERLHVGEPTVKFHMTNIFKTTGFDNRLVLIRAVSRMLGHRA